MATTRGATPIGAAVLAGALAGLIAGLVLAVFMTLLNVANGTHPWSGAKLAGAPFLGARATQPGFDGAAVLVGVLTDLGVSAAWGAAFGLVSLERRLAPGAVAPWIDTRRRRRNAA